MLAKPNRLRRPEEINRVYKRGSYVGSAELGVKYLKTNLPVSRLVVVVPRKVSKLAVVRNRIRRRLVEPLAASWQTVQPGYDIVVNVRADQPAQSGQLSTLLTKAGIIKAKPKSN